MGLEDCLVEFLSFPFLSHVWFALQHLLWGVVGSPKVVGWRDTHLFLIVPSILALLFSGRPLEIGIVQFHLSLGGITLILEACMYNTAV